jgi:ABC-type glycerol-3-phosphate transport system substrate-binding protein
MLQFDQFPIYSAMYDDPQLRALVKKADGQDDFAIYGEQFDYAQARPNFPGYVDASQRLQVQLHKAFLGQESVQKALDTAAQQMKQASGGGNNP